MYELAVPFFPGQEKLQKKIENLRAKIQAKKDEAARAAASVAETRKAPIPLPSPPTSFGEEARPIPRKKANPYSDDELNGSAFIQQEEYEDDDSFSHKPSKTKKSKSAKIVPKSSLKIFADETDGPLTPRTRHLLDIVNSRDVAMIKGLSGVGAKKARDLVEFLELQNEDEGGNIRTLQQLIAVPGLGKRSVERAYEGVDALLV